MKRPIVFLGLAVLTGVVLAATVFRNDVARATGLAQSVVVSNTSAQAVPVKEQALDGGNIKVHEEGTAKVDVQNSSLTVAPPAPITGGGSNRDVPGNTDDSLGETETASALSIQMTSGVSAVWLHGSGFGVSFLGPAEDGPATIELALTRPIQFDTISCISGSGDHCSVSWVGYSP